MALREQSQEGPARLDAGQHVRSVATQPQGGLAATEAARPVAVDQAQGVGNPERDASQGKYAP